MLEPQEKGYSEKAILNTRIESQKLQDQEYLKHQSNPGPFTSTEQVETFMKWDSKRTLVNFSKRIMQYFV